MRERIRGMFLRSQPYLPPTPPQRVFFRGAEMANARTVLELSQGPEDTVRLTHSVRESTAAEDRFGRIELYGNARLSSTLRRVVREVRHPPSRCSTCGAHDADVARVAARCARVSA